MWKPSPMESLVAAPYTTERPMHILIVRLSAIGDVVHALPVLCALRRRFPKATISWLVEDRARDIVEGHPDLDHVFVFERAGLQEGIKRPGRWISTVKAFFGFVRRLRRARFDVSLDVQGNLKSALLLALFRPKTRIGFLREFCREGNFLVNRVRVGPGSGRIHRVEKNLSLLAPLGVTPDGATPRLPSSDEARREAERIMGEINPEGEPSIALHPGTSAFGAFKRWPAERYRTLIECLRASRDVKLLITQGPGEEGIVEEILEGIPARPAVVAPRRISHLVELLRRTSLFIGGDTGPMHIASALGVPVVAIFGPKDPVIYGPRFSPAIVVRKELDCSPCTKRSCDHVECIESITAEEVKEAAISLLDGGR